MNNKNGIFSLWLKNFLCLVFMQSFQAIFMAFIVIIMGKVISGVSAKAIVVSKDGLTGDTSSVYFLCSIIAYAGVTGIIKLQKLVKGIFGIEDSPLLGDLSKSMKSLMHTAFHAMDIGRDLHGAYKAKKSAGIERAAANERVSRISKNMGAINSLASSNGNSSNNTTNINVANGAGGSNGYSKKDLAALFNDSGNFTKDGELISRSPAEQLLYDAQKDQMLAERNYKEAQSKLAVRSLSTIAGLAVASGGSDSLEETISVGNRLGDALNIAGNAVASKPIDAAVRKKAASKISQNNAKARLEEDNKMMYEAMNDAIVDATRDISNSSIPKNSKELKKATENVKKRVSESIKNAADDWLNTQYTVPEEARVSSKQVKPTIERARNAKDNRTSKK